MQKIQRRDKAKVKDDATMAAAVLDLQEVLPTPKSNQSLFYYKRKLNIYNLTMMDSRRGQGHCYVWCEKDGLRGSNEIGSCVYHYLESLQKEGVKKVVLFSDASGGQNRKKKML